MKNSIHRERFALAMAHRESDIVPADLWFDSGDMNVMPAVMKTFGADSGEQLLDLLDIDIFRFKAPVADKSRYEDGTLATYFLPEKHVGFKSFSNDSAPRPLINVDDPKELDGFIWPKAAQLYDFSSLSELAERQEHRVLWAQAGFWSPVFCKMCDLCGIEKVLMDMIVNPDMIDALSERISAFYRESFTLVLEATRGRLDVFSFGDDIATQRGLMFSKEHWNRYFRGPMTEFCELVHSYDVLVSFHSCGAVAELIPEFIETGIDILFPIQPRASGMAAARLKKDFGDGLVFYGGIDIQEVLPFGTPEEVRAEVKDVLRVLSKDGGYIMASGHGIMRDVPHENIRAMYDERSRLTKTERFR
ncbi:MAG: hypothetical protein FWE66_02180 [Oscillospiraceae bacterium]|nr:hypothetical protein [Oscillospiraceae bacterium]